MIQEQLQQGDEDEDSEEFDEQFTPQTMDFRQMTDNPENAMAMQRPENNEVISIDKDKGLQRLKPLLFSVPFCYTVIYQYFFQSINKCLPFGRTCPEKAWIRKFLATFDPHNKLRLVMTADEYALRIGDELKVMQVNAMDVDDAAEVQRYTQRLKTDVSQLLVSTQTLHWETVSLKSKIQSLSYDKRRVIEQGKAQQQIFETLLIDLSKQNYHCLTTASIIAQVKQASKLIGCEVDQQQLYHHIFERLGITELISVRPADYFFLATPMISDQLKLLHYQISLAISYTGSEKQRLLHELKHSIGSLIVRGEVAGGHNWLTRIMNFIKVTANANQQESLSKVLTPRVREFLTSLNLEIQRGELVPKPTELVNLMTNRQRLSNLVLACDDIQTDDVDDSNPFSLVELMLTCREYIQVLGPVNNQQLCTNITQVLDKQHIDKETSIQRYSSLLEDYRVSSRQTGIEQTEKDYYQNLCQTLLSCQGFALTETQTELDKRNLLREQVASITPGIVIDTEPAATVQFDCYCSLQRMSACVEQITFKYLHDAYKINPQHLIKFINRMSGFGFGKQLIQNSELRNQLLNDQGGMTAYQQALVYGKRFRCYDREVTTIGQRTMVMCKKIRLFHCSVYALVTPQEHSSSYLALLTKFKAGQSIEQDHLSSALPLDPESYLQQVLYLSAIPVKYYFLVVSAYVGLYDHSDGSFANLNNSLLIRTIRAAFNNDPLLPQLQELYHDLSINPTSYQQLTEELVEAVSSFNFQVQPPANTAAEELKLYLDGETLRVALMAVCVDAVIQLKIRSSQSPRPSLVVKSARLYYVSNNDDSHFPCFSDSSQIPLTTTLLFNCINILPLTADIFEFQISAMQEEPYYMSIGAIDIYEKAQVKPLTSSVMKQVGDLCIRNKVYGASTPDKAIPADFFSRDQFKIPVQQARAPTMTFK